MNIEQPNSSAAVPVVVRWPRLAAVGYGCLAGLLWSLLTFVSLPPVEVWLVGLMAPLPLVAVGWSTKRAWCSGLGAALGSLPLWGFHHLWIADVSFAGVFPLVGYLGIWIGLVVVVLARVRRAAGPLGPALVAPTVWVGLEFARGEIAFGGYPWFMAGHPMIGSEIVSRAAAVGGVYLVSWLVVSIGSVALAHWFGGRLSKRIAIGLSAALVGLLAASLLFPTSISANGTARVGALQTDVPQDNKIVPSRDQLVADFQALVALMEAAAGDGAELIVTPETVLPGGLLDPAAREILAEPFGDALLSEQARVGVPMLAGCTTLGGVRVRDGRVEWDDTFNSVFLIDAGRVVGKRYDKLRPTPFGETLPYVQSMPWLRDLVLQIGLGASGMDFGLTPGSEPISFSVPVGARTLRVSSPICFESSMAPTVRRIVNEANRQGQPTDLLVVMTNDGWFGSFDIGRRMHLLQARWRCIEHRLPMLRCANTGVSAIIDARGRVIDELPPGHEGVLVGDVPLNSVARTTYARLGDAVGWLCLAATGLLVLIGFVRPRVTGESA